MEVVVDTFWLALSSMLGVLCTLPLAWVAWRVLEGGVPLEQPVSQTSLQDELTFPPLGISRATSGARPQLVGRARSPSPAETGLIPVWAPFRGTMAAVSVAEPPVAEPPRLSVQVTPAQGYAPIDLPLLPAAPPQPRAEFLPKPSAGVSTGLRVGVAKAVRVPPQPEDPTVLIDPVSRVGQVAEGWFR